MKTLSLEVKRLKEVQCEVIGYCLKKAGEKPVLVDGFSRHGELLEGLRKTGELPHQSGAGVFVRFKGKFGGNHVLFVNYGADIAGFDAIESSEKFRRLGAMVYGRLSAERIDEAQVYFDSFLFPEHEEKQSDLFGKLAQGFSEGLLLSSYRFKKYFSKTESNVHPKKVYLNAKSENKFPELKCSVAGAEAIAEAVSIAKNLGNEPSNEMTPKLLAAAAKSLATKYKLKFTEFDEKKLAKEKMGLLLGVGQGSVNPPRLICLEYKHPKARKTLALVGKGVTFDSGGISIKPSMRMEDMKHDMCGAANVLGGVVAIAQLEIPINIVCVVASAENMPDANAIQPGNILKSRNGKTVEVNNTDAEGRLILADALDWVQTEKKPDYVVDAATLTGAVSIALGKACAGLMGNDDYLLSQVQHAAKDAGERVWQLPLFKEYFDDLKSEYADMRNSGDNGYGGTMRGAVFMKQFIKEKTKWAHLDIANMAFDNGYAPYVSRKGSTGFGIRLFVSLAKKLCE